MRETYYWDAGFPLLTFTWERSPNASRRGSGEQKVARREASGSIATMIRALEARTELGAPSVREIQKRT